MANFCLLVVIGKVDHFKLLLRVVLLDVSEIYREAILDPVFGTLLKAGSAGLLKYLGLEGQNCYESPDQHHTCYIISVHL